MILIQKTKLQFVTSGLCGLIWGDGYFDWKVNPTVNRAGGFFASGANVYLFYKTTLWGMASWVLLGRGECILWHVQLSMSILLVASRRNAGCGWN